MDILEKWYPENFIHRRFKIFLSRIHILKKMFLQLRKASVKGKRGT